jgi:alpha,alpha-trehalase
MRVGEHDGSQLPLPKVLREYALLADGERGCLIGPEGECAWLCFPHRLHRRVP